MEMRERDQDLPSFLRLPTEIRLMILELSIGEHTFHILNTDAVIAGDRPASTSNSLAYRECGAINAHRLPGLTATCRQLFAEANPILYQNTTMVFSCIRSMHGFFLNNTLALSLVRRLAFQCGPAKHLSRCDKTWHRRAFSMLQHKAHRLRELHVSFRTYYKIQSDRHLLSNFWFHRLVSLPNLVAFSMYIDLRMVGPINYTSVPESTHLHKHLLCTEKVLQAFLTGDRVVKTSKEIIKHLQKEIELVSGHSHTSHEVPFIEAPGYSD